MKFKFLIILAVLMHSIVFTAFADTSATESIQNKFLNKVKKDSPLLEEDTLVKLAQELEINERLSDIAKEKYFQQQYNFYYSKSLEHRWITFSWQHMSGVIIFWVVILIVLSGLVFAGIQFYITMKSLKLKEKIIAASPTPSASDLPAAEGPKSEVELSMTGLKVNSSVLGVIILVISLAFFYMYMIYVYPINQLNTDSTGFTNHTEKEK